MWSASSAARRSARSVGQSMSTCRTASRSRGVRAKVVVQMVDGVAEVECQCLGAVGLEEAGEWGCGTVADLNSGKLHAHQSFILALATARATSVTRPTQITDDGGRRSLESPSAMPTTCQAKPRDAGNRYRT